MAVATLFGAEMTALVGNSGGNVQSLPTVSLVGGRRRTAVATIPLASQASGSTIGLARLPLYAVLLAITLVTDTSLGSSTIALGDANTANLFVAAQTFTATNTPTNVGKASALGVAITQGYDCVTGNATAPFMPQTPGQGGGAYEDITMLIATAAFPSSGNLKVMFEYAID